MNERKETAPCLLFGLKHIGVDSFMALTIHAVAMKLTSRHKGHALTLRTSHIRSEATIYAHHSTVDAHKRYRTNYTADISGHGSELTEQMKYLEGRTKSPASSGEKTLAGKYESSGVTGRSISNIMQRTT